MPNLPTLRAPVPLIPLLFTCVGILLSIRLLHNVVARFMDYWMPSADRRHARVVVKIYKILAIASVVFIAVGAVLYELRVT